MKKSPDEITISIRKVDNGVHMQLFQGGFRSGEMATHAVVFQDEAKAEMFLCARLIEMDVEWSA